MLKMQSCADRLIEKHNRLWSDPSTTDRLVTFAWSVVKHFDVRQILSDPAKSLEYSLRRWEERREFQDDSIPMTRVEIGTGLVASAFGAELLSRDDNLPAVGDHPVTCLADLERVQAPDPLNAGYFPLVYDTIRYFREHMPEDFRLSHCDLQGPWNTAQLLAGDKMFYDVYDNPDFVDALMDAVTDFMIRTVPIMKEAIGEEWDSFYLMGTKIPGASRLCNCSVHMVSPDFYERHVLERDQRFFEATNGGMMHYCGGSSHCIEHFNKIEGLHGLDVGFNFLDLFEVADMLREDIVLICTGGVETPVLTELGAATLDRLSRGEFPDKKNIIYHFDDPANLDKCKLLYEAIHRG